MPRFLPTLTLGLALAFFGCSTVSTMRRGPVPWPQASSDLKPDPAIAWGRLENGLRYAILPHAIPARRASIFLVVEVGAYEERNGELGYAHFVEHMALRDVRDVPGGVFASLQRLGVGDGPHSVGTTNSFETIYRFDNLPTDDAGALATALKLLRGVADGVEFKPDGVARERGVIFDEQRSRDAMMANARADEAEFAPPQSTMPRPGELAAVFGDTHLIRRPTIGAEKTLRAANADNLRAFYERWYRPERMVLAIAGDVTAADVDAAVRATFVGVRAHGRVPAEPVPAVPQATTKLRVHADEWNTEPATRLALAVYHPQTAPDSTERRRESLVRRVAFFMLEGRYERAARSDPAPLLSAEVIASHYVPSSDVTLLRATAEPARWTNALAELDLEVHRAIAQGFTAPELERAIKWETKRVETAARHAAERSSADLAHALALSTARGVVFTSAEDDRALTLAQLKQITAEQCQAALRDWLPREKLSFAIAGPFPEGVTKADTADKVLAQSRAAALTPYAPPPPLRPFPFTDFGPAGTVVKREHSDVLDADLIQFANGVRLNLKHTTFEPGRVRVVLRLDGGRLACPADLPGLDLKTFAWAFGGLRDLSLEELGACLTDLDGGFGLSISPGEIRVTEGDDVENLPLLLQFAAAYFVQPGYREERRALEVARGAVAQYAITASGVVNAALQLRMSGNHPAQQVPTFEQISQRTMGELKAWLSPQLLFAPLEISIIGDFAAPAAIDAVARTFGALTRRTPQDLFAEARRVAFPPPPFDETIEFTGNQGVAAVALAWPVSNGGNFATRFRAQIVGSILGHRLWEKLRGELGETYVLGAGFNYDDTFRPSPSTLSCSVEAAPDRVTKVAAVVREVAEGLARDGATADEFERARQPFVRDTESGLRDNDWLLDKISVAQSNPAYATNWVRALDEYRATTREEINALAREIFVKDRLCQIIAKPK